MQVKCSIFSEAVIGHLSRSERDTSTISEEFHSCEIIVYELQ